MHSIFGSYLCSAALLIGLAVLTGCDRAIVSGRVLTIDGETLPGVVVTVEDEPGLDALTNSLGEYRLIPPVGPHALRYTKSGYAPAVSAVDVAPRAAIAMDDVIMWRLPRSKGVYLYEDGRFISATHAEPRTFLLEGETADYAIRGQVGVRTENTEPLILCYHMPRYEARLTRLRVATAQLKEGQDYTFEVFARGGSTPVRLMPVDQPEGMLMQVVVDEPFEEGVYALHWGALVGDTILEARAYLFEIGDASETVDEPDHSAVVEDGETETGDVGDVPDAEASDETENE